MPGPLNVNQKKSFDVKPANQNVEKILFNHSVLDITIPENPLSKNLASILLSIIVPTYNRGDHIVHLVKSLEKIKGISFEVILMDDGSSDETPDRVRSYFQQNHRNTTFEYCYVDRELSDNFINRVGSIRNLGAMKAQGDYLLFLDSDIMFDTAILTKDLLSLIGNDIYQPFRVNLTHSQTLDVYKDDDQAEKYLNANKEAKLSWKTSIEKKNLDLTQWGASYFWLMKKESFKTVGGFKDCYTTYGWEDTDFILRARDHERNLIPLEAPVLHLNAENMFVEYSDDNIDRKIKLAEGAEILFHNNLDSLSFRCLYYGLIRAYIMYKGLSSFFDSPLKSEYLELLNYDAFLRLVNVDLGYSLVKFNFKESHLVNSHKEFLNNLLKEKIKLGKVLIISERVSLLPTILFLEPKLEVSEIKSIILQSGANYLDDLINFKDLIGWRFKSALLKNYRIKSSHLELSLPNKNKEIINHPLKFDSLIIITSSDRIDPVRIESLDKNTQVFNLKTIQFDNLNS